MSREMIFQEWRGNKDIFRRMSQEDLPLKHGLRKFFKKKRNDEREILKE